MQPWTSLILEGLPAPPCSSRRLIARVPGSSSVVPREAAPSEDRIDGTYPTASRVTLPAHHQSVTAETAALGPGHAPSEVGSAAAAIGAGPDHVEVDVEIGYRIWKVGARPARGRGARGILLYFHGNGEVASDYDSFSELYRLMGLHLVVVDFRGYGWSTKTTPCASTLLSDAEPMLADGHLDAALRAAGINPRPLPLILFGRDAKGDTNHVAPHLVSPCLVLPHLTSPCLVLPRLTSSCVEVPHCSSSEDDLPSRVVQCWQGLWAPMWLFISLRFGRSSLQVNHANKLIVKLTLHRVSQSPFDCSPP